jgi:threonine dehydratase
MHDILWWFYSGQGTVFLELLELVPEIDTIFVLISGMYYMNFFAM